MSTPNIVYVFADQFRQRAMGFRNEDKVITPNLDAFSRESLEMCQMTSNFPVCSPYRAMLMTGRYPMKTGVLTNCHSQSVQYGNYLKEDEICISDVLFENGYETGYIGKWHLDPGLEEQLPYVNIEHRPWIWDSFTPKNRRHQFKFWHTYGCYDEHMTPHYWTTDAKLEERLDIHEWSCKHETDVAIEYIENKEGKVREEGKPFCLMVSYNPPHMPFEQVPEKYVRMYDKYTDDELLNNENAYEIADALKNARYYFAGVTGVDDQFGRILKTLKEQNLMDNTIVVFTADHGEMMGSHGLQSCKNYFFNESVQVPFLISYPKAHLKGKCEQMMSVVDIYPTLLDLCGLKDKIPSCVEGHSLLSYMQTNSYDENEYAYYGSSRFRIRGIIGNKYTFAMQKFQGHMREFLFDNEHDKAQRFNLVQSQPQLADALRAKLIQKSHELGDPWHEKNTDLGCY